MNKEVVFDEKGLVPAVVQDVRTREVLTLAYMSEESLEKTMESGETWFYSRSRNELWHKGATSGNTQRVVEIKKDCDRDALVVLVEPNGPACHTGARSCFDEKIYENSIENRVSEENEAFSILSTLQNVIKSREETMPEGAYTTYLFEKGVDKILKKVGEEAAEVIIAAKNRDREELKWESADLLFHLLVLLQEQKVPLQEVLGVLQERHNN
ncbi:phosphoribosyl-ATP pyrophosphatase [Bacillus coahuilensis m2-6]|uniref:Histidine biosynthesis bifunctional protein HisIE n=1 Tax=Bacillus coahuilensis p1.1.43 TaxID=1150625 RepID=A0A147K5W0_9BACI|nr:bifunctional phosphoribosyl-AMP cyclohydrolase/phosphoribosyl-ATP diphosphatase HisIE [Bacillus coahuilensis]KUP05203.1 phosphoribosyl-ATP pyrophosphatase [Bacillus coahuilensis p1.1.43]KUP05654.1 phosphoribosyl-ATP pyrophosphatase [Bacillus coahuilensis m2-6]